MKGSPMSTMVELSDVSFHGCRMRTLSNAGSLALNARIAFGFVLPNRNIALAKGHIVRRIEDSYGSGVGMVIDRANVAFYEFLMTLAESETVLAA
jgi:hypothetical protein